tara:strand:- start:351 stop:662 length:312 start_codon:yes stop_codon:yes gene_type:complete
MQNLKFFLASTMALSMFICLITSALIPINNLTFNISIIGFIQSISFFIFTGSFITSRLVFKETREKTFDFFKNFLKKKEKKVVKKDIPDPGCTKCKKKKKNKK